MFLVWLRAAGPSGLCQVLGKHHQDAARTAEVREFVDVSVCRHAAERIAVVPRCYLERRVDVVNGERDAVHTDLVGEGGLRLDRVGVNVLEELELTVTIRGLENGDLGMFSNLIAMPRMLPRGARGRRQFLAAAVSPPDVSALVSMRPRRRRLRGEGGRAPARSVQVSLPPALSEPTFALSKCTECASQGLPGSPRLGEPVSRPAEGIRQDGGAVALSCIDL